MQPIVHQVDGQANDSAFGGRQTTDVRTLRRVRSLRPSLLIALAVALAGAILVGAGAAQAATKVQVSRSFVKGSDGQLYWVTNHQGGGVEAPKVKAPSKAAAATAAPTAAGSGKEYLVVWAGHSDAADTKGSNRK